MTSAVPRQLAAALMFLAAPVLGAELPAAPGRAGPESAANENLELMKNGDYEGAMLGFMDMVIEDPGDGKAREYLKQAGEHLAAQEGRTVLSERKKLLEEAVRYRQMKRDLRVIKRKRSAEWEKFFSGAVALARDADSIKEAVDRYEQWLEMTPVYSDNRKDFTDGMARIKDAFYGTIKGKYPYLVEGRTYADERDLAALSFAQESLADMPERYLDSSQTQDVLNKADKLRHLEAKIAEHYDSIEQAVDLFVRRHYAESLVDFKKVLAFDSRNEEAGSFSEQAQEKLGPERAAEKQAAASK